MSRYNNLYQGYHYDGGGNPPSSGPMERNPMYENPQAQMYGGYRGGNNSIGPNSNQGGMMGAENGRYNNQIRSDDQDKSFMWPQQVQYGEMPSFGHYGDMSHNMMLQQQQQQHQLLQQQQPRHPGQPGQPGQAGPHQQQRRQQFYPFAQPSMHTVPPPRQQGQHMPVGPRDGGVPSPHNFSFQWRAPEQGEPGMNEMLWMQRQHGGGGGGPMAVNSMTGPPMSMRRPPGSMNGHPGMQGKPMYTPSGWEQRFVGPPPGGVGPAGPQRKQPPSMMWNNDYMGYVDSCQQGGMMARGGEEYMYGGSGGGMMPLGKSASLGDKESAGTKSSGRSCSNCGATQTPKWRRGKDKLTLCNACGLQDAKVSKSGAPNKDGGDGPNGAMNASEQMGDAGATINSTKEADPAPSAMDTEAATPAAKQTPLDSAPQPAVQVDAKPVKVEHEGGPLVSKDDAVKSSSPMTERKSSGDDIDDNCSNNKIEREDDEARRRHRHHHNKNRKESGGQASTTTQKEQTSTKLDGALPAGDNKQSEEDKQVGLKPDPRIPEAPRATIGAAGNGKAGSSSPPIKDQKMPNRPGSNSGDSSGGEGQSQTEGDSNGETNGDSNGDTNGESNGDTNGESNGDTNGESNDQSVVPGTNQRRARPGSTEEGDVDETVNGPTHEGTPPQNTSNGDGTTDRGDETTERGNGNSSGNDDSTYPLKKRKREESGVNGDNSTGDNSEEGNENGGTSNTDESRDENGGTSSDNPQSMGQNNEKRGNFGSTDVLAGFEKKRHAEGDSSQVDKKKAKAEEDTPKPHGISAGTSVTGCSN